MADDVVVNDLTAQAVPAADAAPIPDATAAPENAPSSGDQQPGDEQVKAKSFTEDEVNDIVQKRIAKEQRKAQREADRRVAEALAQAQAKAPKADAPAPSANDRPKPENFQTTEDYVEAVSEWKAEQIIDRKTKERAEATAANEQERYQREIQTAHVEREDTARDKYSDYDDVVGNPRLPINAVMADAIRMSDQGPDIAYHLGKHPEEAAKIAKLPPILAVKELGKLEAKLAAEPPTPTKRSSSAPEPINPVRPAAGNTFSNLHDPKALKAMGTSGWIEADRKRRMDEAKARQSR